MLGLLKLPCRRVLSAAQVSFHSCSHSYFRSQPAVNIGTCPSPSRQRVIQCVRGYANSSGGIKETESEGFKEGGGAVSESISSSADTCSPSQSLNRPPSFELQDLPDLPHFPAKPTIHIIPEDITTYLQPLVSRHWRVSHVQKGLDEREVLALNKTFHFKGFNDVMDFIQGVADISREEKHHARILIEYSTVVISTHTHSAYTFHRLPSGKYESRKVRGLTRRDVRFAIKIEELHDKFKERERALETVPAAVGELQRQSMNLLLRRYGKTRTFAKTEDVHKRRDGHSG